MYSWKWVVDEVRKAIVMGYDLMIVLVFWEYEVTCFDKGKNSGLFAENLNTVRKLKQESSGYHPGFRVRRTRTSTSRTTGAKKELISTTHQFPKKAGHRPLAKLKLNSK